MVYHKQKAGPIICQLVLANCNLRKIKNTSFKIFIYLPHQLAQTSDCRFKGVTENGTGPTSSAQGNITKEQFLELPAHLIGMVCL